MKRISADEINGAGNRLFNENKQKIYPKGFCETAMFAVTQNYIKQVWLIAFKEGISFENQRIRGKNNGNL